MFDLRTAEALGLFGDGAIGLVPAGCVDQLERHLVNLQAADEVIAGRARRRANQGGSGPCESVKQATLAGVGLARQYDPERSMADGALDQLLLQQRDLG